MKCNKQGGNTSQWLEGILLALSFPFENIQKNVDI